METKAKKIKNEILSNDFNLYPYYVNTVFIRFMIYDILALVPQTSDKNYDGGRFSTFLMNIYIIKIKTVKACLKGLINDNVNNASHEIL